MANNTELKRQIEKLRRERDILRKDRLVARRAIIEKKGLERELKDLKNPNSTAFKLLVRKGLRGAGKKTLMGSKVIGKTLWLIAKDLENKRLAKAKASKPTKRRK